MSEVKGGLPNGWTDTTLGDVTVHKSGNSKLIKGKLYSKGGNGRFQGYSASGADVWCDGNEYEGDAIIVSAVGARCGKAFRTTGKWNAIANTHIVWPESNALLVDFAQHLMNNEHFWIKGGSAQPFVKVNATFELPFKLPPLAEQRRIVAKIEALQERSRQVREALAGVKPLLEQFRQSVLAAAFRGDLTAHWRAAHPDIEPASELLKRIRAERRKKWESAELAKFKAKGKQPPKGWQEKYEEPEPVDDSELPELPKGWCWTTIGAIVTDSRTGLVRSAKEQDESTGVPYIRMQHYDLLGRWNSTGLTCVHTSHEEFTLHQLQASDVLFNSRNSYDLVGKVAIWPMNRSGFVFNNNLVRLRFVESATPQWIAAQMQSPGFQSRIHRFKSATTSVCALYTRDLMAQPIAIAPVGEQEHIARALSAYVASLEAVESIEADSQYDLSHLDQSILAKAFRGELVPQDPNDEPASVLLDRIRQQRATAVRGQTEREKDGKQKKRKRATTN